MKVTDYIALTIDRFPKGYVFTYADFRIEVNKKQATIKALNRMAESGKIVKLAKGRYYKPENTPFGILKPEQRQVVKDLLETDGKVIGYLTGLSIFPSLGLTTQVSNTIQIGKNEVRPSLSRGSYKISFVRQKNTITKESIPPLQLLDAIRYIKKIPGTSVNECCLRFINLLKEKSVREQQTLVRLAQKYPPSTRALLGAILDILGEKELIKSLRNTLNPITEYKLGIATETLPTSNDWNIK